MAEAPRIAACLIVKDSAQTIENAIASIRDHVDAICVYDTGSTDTTPSILAKLAKQPGAPIIVEQGEWRDDFAWARAQSFNMVPDDCGWYLWLDDDDIVEGAEHLRAMAANAAPGLDGYVFFYDYARTSGGVNQCQLWRERLIRRGTRDWRWSNAVHEVLTLPDGASPNYEMVPPELCKWVHHRPEGRYDSERNLVLLDKQYRRCLEDGQEPDARLLAYLGTETMTRGRFEEAAGWFVQYLDKHADTAWSDERMQVRHKLATCLRYMGQVHASIEAEFLALRERDDWAETSAGLAESFAAMGDWPRCERWAKRTLELGMPQSLLILNPLEFSFMPLVLLSRACLAMGRGDEARSYAEGAAAVEPEHPITGQLLAEVQQVTAQAELVQSVAGLADVLRRHDENLKALHVLESAPYMVAEHPVLVQMLREQRRLVRHKDGGDQYEKVYQYEQAEIMDDEKAELIAQNQPRTQRLVEMLLDQAKALGRKPVVADLGCNEGWTAAHLWRAHAIEVDGWELNAKLASVCEQRLRRVGAPGSVTVGDLHAAADQTSRRYDAVVLYEVIEHVPDPQATLDACERLLQPDGIVYISTPNGAYDRGFKQLAPFERDGVQHLRAVPVQELGLWLHRRGRVEALEEHHEGRVGFAAYRPKAYKGRVVMHGGFSVEQWSPKNLNTTGLGGSETALVRVSDGLSERGWDVEVYADAHPGVYGNTLWRPKHLLDPDEPADAVIVSRAPEAFDETFNAPVRALWCHDQAYGSVTPERAARMSHIVVLSEWQRGFSECLYPAPAEKFTIIRNGIVEVPASVPGFADRDPVVCYSSAPDRGLRVLLELWPRIMESAPEARLEVFYGWDVFDRVALGNPALQVYKSEILEMIRGLNDRFPGAIVWRGRIGQRDLAERFRTTRVLGYPASFRETSCITAMEARAAGLPIVTSRLAALTNTVGKHGILIPIPGDDDAPGMNANEAVVAGGVYGKRFAREVGRLLTDAAYWAQWSAKARDGADTLTWERQIDAWEALIEQRVDAKVSRQVKRARARAAA